MLIGAVVVLALLASLGIGGIGWPELLVAIVPIVGGIVLGSLWWIPLYPAGLAAWLRVADRVMVADVIRRADDNGLVRAALREIYLKTPDEMRNSLISVSRPCRTEWCVTEWNILALAALCAAIGTVVGKVLATRIAR